MKFGLRTDILYEVFFFFKLTVTNKVMMQNFEVVCDTFNADTDYKAPLFGDVIQRVEKMCHSLLD